MEIWAHAKYYVRIDYRLMASCCPDDTSRINACIALDDYVESGAAPIKNIQYIDKNWLDQAIYNYDEEVTHSQSPSDQLARVMGYHEDERNIAGIIILGETDYTIPLMRSPPFPALETGRAPKDAQIFCMLHRSNAASAKGASEWERRYVGSYIPRPLAKAADH